MEENGYRKLAIAVLEQAVKDYESSASSKRDDAKKWFKEKSRDTFGFFWCLELAEVSPPLVMRHLAKIDAKFEKKLAKVSV